MAYNHLGTQGFFAPSQSDQHSSTSQNGHLGSSQKDSILISDDESNLIDLQYVADDELLGMFSTGNIPPEYSHMSWLNDIAAERGMYLHSVS